MAADYDVAVVGAGPAGAWTAYRLAAAGARVALIDGSHPREKPCGGGITARAFELIRSAIGSASFPVVAIRTASFAASGRSAAVSLPRDADAFGWLGIVSRREFDGALLAAAQHAGAHHVAARARAIDRTTDGWSIVAGTTRVASAWLIGADGAASVVRRRVTTPFPRAELSVATGYYVRGATSADIAIDFDDTPTGYVWSFPRADHLAVGACAQADVACPRSLLARTQRWIEGHVARIASLERYSWPIPSLSERALLAEHPAGERWMLAGDAAGLVDPITREGIYFALLSAEHAATSLCGTAPAVDYARRMKETVFQELIHAARLKARFFRPELLALLVRALNRSGRVRAIMADLVSGRQTYSGLRRRLLATFELQLIGELFRL
jgi:geranylgeranyl diphosphate/geranylgeranyl-bacteriochlorophyllide a reductase